MSVPKIVEITYEIFQWLSKRRFYKEFVGKSQQCQSNNLIEPKTQYLVSGQL